MDVRTGSLPSETALGKLPEPARASTATLALLALGVVYGDIGTSPLYAAKETFNPDHGIPLTATNVLGGISAIFWALMLVVSLKYVALVLRANNRGEGGIMALLALATSAVREPPKTRTALLLVGVFGASLFYGDAVLTPAISVLSAVEGLEVGTSALVPYIVPIATAILVALFTIQRFGTGVVGAFFGPVCLLWFIALGAVGVAQIARAPVVLAALDPRHADARHDAPDILRPALRLALPARARMRRDRLLPSYRWRLLRRRHAQGAGRRLVPARARLRGGAPPLDDFLKLLLREPPGRVPGTAVFLTSTQDATPNALLHSLRHYKVLHTQNVFLTIEFAEVPWIAGEERVSCERIAGDCWRMVARYGFMEQPDVALALAMAGPMGLEVDPMQVSYFLSREKLVSGASEHGIARLRDRLLAAMARNAGSITDFCNIPTNRVVELGTRIEL